MKLDHISYVTSHEQIADTIQRIGSRIGSTFVDGGIHPRFGTRNFTAALHDGRYIEVVCPLDHPATELTPWGKAVSKKVADGGGWFTWVFNVNDIEPLERKFGRTANEGHRVRPDGTDLKWKQIGVREIDEFPQLPFFIQWLSEEHPSKQGLPEASISKIKIADPDKLSKSWFREEIQLSLKEIEIEWIDSTDNENLSGIVSVELLTQSGMVTLD